jgi:lipopolysaccharide export system protein LptA
MGLSVGKVRVGLLVGAGLLVAVVLGFVGYARYAGRRFVQGLPARLGVDVKQTTDNFTYSQSMEGKTVYTIHAAKSIQHNDGTVTLRDVGIVLYGRKGDRADHIYGDEFGYDQKAGIVKAMGEVRIDLQAPAAGFKGKPDGGVHETGRAPTGTADPQVVHVKTRGLIFHKDEGLATTTEQIDFVSGGMTGTAVGAEYSSNTGVLVLETAVHVSGLMKDRPGVLTATHAELDRAGNKAVFTTARYTSPGQGLAADHAVVHTTKDGTPQAMEAQGHVRLTGDGNGAVTSERMDAVLNDKGRLESSHLYGGVQYANDDRGTVSKGNGQEARVSFDGEGRVSRVDMTGSVTGEQQGPAGTRTLGAQRLVLAMMPEGKTHTVLKEATATGAAHIREVGKGAVVNEMSGDTLRAEFVAAGGMSRISSLDGTGNTVLHQVAENGAEATSTGASLTMSFRPMAGKKDSQAEVDHAVQRGGVKVVRTVPAKKGAAAQVEHAFGDEETYDGTTGRVTLRGRAEVDDASGQVYADQVTMERGSGDAAAAGGVRTTYVAANAKSTDDPTHVLADHAEFKHDLGTAFFYGNGSKPARLWQGASQVEAPVLEFVQAEKKLLAHGDPANDAPVVRGVLLGAKSSAGKPTVVRVAGREMVYSDGLRQVEMKGHVRVEDPDGVLTSDRATVFLAAAKTATKPAAAGLMGGEVERVVAVGGVKVEQPGRRGTGAQLVYTAADRTFVMTGTKAAPPTMTSDGRNGETPGTVTGGALRFRSGDDSVLISDETGGAQTTPGRVKTEVRVKDDGKTGSKATGGKR